MIAEALRPVVIEVPPRNNSDINRNDFGPGDAGQRAYQMVAAGALCEARVENGEYCDRSSVGTIGVDIPGVGCYDQFPHCGVPHRDSIKASIYEEYLDPTNNHSGHAPSFDFNGWGRA